MSGDADHVTHLWRWTFDRVPAHQCFDYAAGPLDGLVRCGFSYSSAACRFFEIDRGEPFELLDGQGSDPRLSEVDLARVFEVRIFSKCFDLEWTRHGETGRLVISTDDADVKAVLSQESCAHHGLPWVSEEGPIPVSARDHSYLLWGEALAAWQSWTRMVAPRIGSLWVPAEIGRGLRGHVRAREYFTRGKYGNVVFCGERLLGIEPASADKTEQNSAT